MDIQRLISVVAENPPLWNSKNRTFSNRLVTDKIWESISSDLNQSKEDCKKKWKYLKDEYRKALRKVPRTSSGAGAGTSQTHVSKFKYFNLLSFLKDNIAFTGGGHMEPNNVAYAEKNNIEDNFEDIQVIDESSTMSSYSGDMYDNDNTNKSINVNHTNKQSLKRRQYDEEAAYLNMERKKQKHLQTDIDRNNAEDSDDLHFFKSLLPYVKDLPATRKLCLRAEFLKIVMNYNEDDQLQ